MSKDSFLNSLLTQQAEAKARYDLLSKLIKEYTSKEEEPPTKNNLSVFIRDARLEKGLTQVELGKAVGYQSNASTTISRIEKGEVLPRVAYLEKFAKVLDVDFDQLVALRTQVTESQSTD